MKKIYSAPEIMFEDFSLSSNIAAGCEKIVNPHLYECGVNFPGIGIIFTDDALGCIEKVESDTKTHDGFCYHVPQENKNLFNS